MYAPKRMYAIKRMYALKLWKRYGSLIMLAVLTGLSRMPAGADTALVIGINRYPHLDGGNLEGCVNDANSVKQALQKRGFKVVALTDDQATKEAIQAKLHELSGTVHNDERFVFYFAGHGSHDDAYKCMLLASDAEETNFNHVLYKEDLQGALADIHARSKTMLLDACFSEGLLRGKGVKFRRNRFHQIRMVRQAGKSKRLPIENESDNNNEILPGNLCGFAASTRHQPSAERNVSGETHGIFTFYLIQHLDARPVDESWDDLVTDVSSHVAADMDQQQTPVFAPNGYRRIRVFDPINGKKPEPGPDDRTLWDDYVDNKANPDYIQVDFSLGPDVTSVKRGTKFDVTLTVGKANGYLIALNKDASDHIYLFYPDPDKYTSTDAMVEHARVTAGRTITLGTEGADLGTERVKAILFHSEQDARELLAKFPRGANGATPQQLKRMARPRKLTPHGEHIKDKDNDNDKTSWTFYTSMKQVDVADGDSKNDNEDGAGLSSDRAIRLARSSDARSNDIRSNDIRSNDIRSNDIRSNDTHSARHQTPSAH